MDKIILDMYSLLKRISDNCEEFRKPYGWETDQDGFVPVDSIKQMEIPFCD